MAYELRAVIAKLHIVERLASDWRLATAIPLGQDFGLVPMTDELHADIIELADCDDASPIPEFDDFSQGLLAVIERASNLGPVAYVEAEFIGGLGSQSAAVWLKGRFILSPVRTDYGFHREPAADSASRCPFPINRALERLGVVPGKGQDAFDTLRLGRHRATDDWASSLPNSGK